MPDKKISELNSASAVYDADDFALVQDAETKQVNASVVKTYVKIGLVKGDVGLGNVDNTSDATKNSATVTLTNKTLTSPVISGGTINNAAIGGTTPAAGNFKTLGATGAVTLGTTTTDTVTVNGYMGVGGAGVSNAGVLVGSSSLGGTTQRGVAAGIVGNGSATTAIVGFNVFNNTAATAFTCADVIGFRAQVGSRGATSTVTNWHGVFVEDQTQGTNNYGITSQVSSGTNKWNIYASGTANNYFAGNVGIGTSSPGAKLDVRGSATTGSAAVFSAVSIPDTNGNRGGFGVVNASGGYLGGVTAQQIAGGNYPNAVGWLDVWVQNGASTVTAATFDSSGNLGLGVTPDNSYNACLQLKSGITFPATQNASSNANTLDDYEEGTWTPAATASTTAPTVITTGTGFYTKIGRQVTVTCSSLDGVNMAGSVGSLKITGLPFTSGASTGNGAMGACLFYKIDTPTGAVTLASWVSNGTDFVNFYATIDNAIYQTVADNSTNDGRIWFTLTYFV